VNWVRLNFTAGQGSSGNARIMLTADLWAVQSVTNHVDGHLFVGDSTALHSMYHGNVSFSPSVTCLDFGSICRTGGFILTGTITTAGTGYTNGTYIDIPLTVVSNNTGIAANAIGNITIGGGGVTAVTLQSPGYGFTIGDTLSVAAANVGGTGSGFVYTVNTVQSAQKYSSYTPMNLCADMSGWKASQWATYCTTTYPGVFSDFPGQYVWIMLGTNAEQDAPAQTNYSAAMQSIITASQAAGKTVIIEKMITGTPTEPSNWMSNCNATIATLIANNPGTLLGADMSGWQLNYSSVHPDGYGCASQRIFRAQYACSMS
jgi:hypothetical protein